MIKKYGLFFLMVCCAVFGFAQQAPDLKFLQNFAKQYRIKEDADRSRAISMAKVKGWPIYKLGTNGSVLALQYIGPNGNPVYYRSSDNIIAAATTRANQLWPGGSSGLNLTGSSSFMTSKLGTWDGGPILRTHVELAGRILQMDSTENVAISDHATHTTGTLMATGINPIAKGMSNGLQQLLAHNFINNEISKIITDGPKLILSNHSYGIPGGWFYDGTNWNWNGDTTISTTKSYIFGWYSQASQIYDSIAHNLPGYLMVFAAGNSNGNDAGSAGGPSVGGKYLYNGGTSVTRTSRIPSNPTYGSVEEIASAKNTLVVGAVNGIAGSYSSPSDVQIAPFSCWGPTNDGRLKPDVVADGVNVTSSSSTSNTAYETMSGTSMATPNATGSLFLLQEYYKQKHGYFMQASTLKALAIQTADEAGTSEGPDYVYGYGLLDVLRGSQVITSSYNQKTDTIIEKTLTSGSPYSFNVIASGIGPLKATLSWTDPQGVVDSINLLDTKAVLVNNLDLRITAGTSTYYPWILNSSNPTAAATRGDDNVNNNEQVQVDSIVPGRTYTVTVSNKGYLAGGKQAFSLIVSGIGGTAYCTSASTNSTGSRIDSVSFAGITNKNIAGHSSYSNFTNLTASIQPNQTIPIAVNVNSSNNSSSNRVVKVYMDFNNDGSFTDAGDLVATNQSNISAISGTGGLYTGTITIPAGLTIGNYGIVRIVLQDSIAGTATTGPCGTYAYGETQDYRFQVISPANDVALGSIVDPLPGSCSNTSQFITVVIKNAGSNSETGIPVTAVISTGGNKVATITNTYPGTIASGGNVTFTLQTPFTGVAGTTYNVVVYTALSNDQNRLNDTLSETITIASSPSAPTGTAEVCSTNGVYLTVDNPNSASNYLWYTSETGTPIAEGSSVSISATNPPKMYYLSSGYNGSVGPKNKNVYPGGGYNNFSGNYVNITASVPVNINYAKLYIGYPGQITFAVAQLSDITSTGYNYVVLSQTTIDAYATTPTPTTANSSGAANPDNAADSGAYYYLNLAVPAGASAIIINPNTSSTATIFRNLDASATIYPQSIPNVFSITGNSVSSSGTSANFQNYYYFFYDVKFSTADCISPFTVIATTTSVAPTLSQSGSKLVCNVTNAAKYQWFYNGTTGGSTLVNGATGDTYTPTRSGNYTLTVTDSAGCVQTTSAYNYVVTAVQNANPADIGLVVSPNPNNGAFHVGFTTQTAADLSVELISTTGQVCIRNSYSNFSGTFSQQFNSSNLASGSYILKIEQDGKVYNKQILIVK